MTSGNPGATWNYAKDFYSGEGSDITWAGGNDWSSSDFTAIRDTFLTPSNGWTQFNNDNFQNDIEQMINGVYGVASFAVWAEVDSRSIYGTEYSDVARRPRIVVEYTVSESGSRPFLRRRRMLRSQEN